MDLTLWIRTKNEKGESGFSVNSIDHALERFKEYKNKFDKIYTERHEKPREFSAKVTDENDKVILSWAEFKKLLQ